MVQCILTEVSLKSIKQKYLSDFDFVIARNIVSGIHRLLLLPIHWAAGLFREADTAEITTLS